MGSLCWARRTVVLALVEALGLGTDARGASDALESSAAELDRVREQLPPELAGFAERFANDLSSALSLFEAGAAMSPDDAAWLFDFEAYPAVARYIALAERTPDCVDM